MRVFEHEGATSSKTNSNHLDHGLGVSSAALFGHIDPSVQLPQPYCFIDHHRVTAGELGSDPHELPEVLCLIDEVLSSTEYDFVNISLGPPLAVEDDEIHTWTAVLDDRFARTSTLATIAVGNNGQSDATERLNRIQVPSDCVNVLAIGACDTPGEGWRRAPYSAVGPGRQPGFVKPDLLEFGGYGDRVFLTVAQKIRSNTATLIGVMGTSYASPSVLRLAAGIKAHYGNYLSNLAIRGLLIHTSENNDSSVEEIGWGRVARNLAKVVSCSDNAIRVIYQGEISPTKFVRAWLPYINDEIKGMVSITATLCYKTEVDPGHPSNYTRAGLEAVFRPNDKKYSGTADINPKSEPFFGLRKKILHRDGTT